MERLTEKRNGQDVIPLRQDGKLEWTLSGRADGMHTQFLYGVHADKLADYEELEDRLKEQFNGCVELNMIVDAIIEYDKQLGRDEKLAKAMLITNDSVRKFREWESLEEQGKLLKLPCAVGDKLYEPRHDRGMVTEYIVTNISYFGNNYEIFISWKLNSGIYSNLSGVHASEIGKTVFLTQEEAEAALAEVEND